MSDLLELPSKKWGVKDCYDGQWIGGKDGPFLFDLPDLAQTAAMAICIRMHWPPGRVKVHVWTGWGKPRVTGPQGLYDEPV